MAMSFTMKEEGHYVLDVTGYVCPHPQIYTKKALQKIKSGEILDVVFDNPSSSESVSAMCDSEGHDIINKDLNSGKYVYSIKKS